MTLILEFLSVCGEIPQSVILRALHQMPVVFCRTALLLLYNAKTRIIVEHACCLH
uniref:Uncharacterized protein n=1 Tax=Rhizophora mucronata TaxID=61149 RepID=A0A2P2L7K1_RHIMU